MARHVFEEDGKDYWRFDSGKIREIPEMPERRKIIEDCHVELLHRGSGPIYYELKKKYYWPGIKEDIRQIIKRCELCVVRNRKRKGGTKFIETSRPGQRIGIDIAAIEGRKQYALILVDYFTRFTRINLLENKKSKTVCEIVRNLLSGENMPEEIFTDNGPEFKSDEFAKCCTDLKIRHIRSGVEGHQSNGRVERLILSIKETLAKCKGKNLEERLYKVQSKYNATYHSGLQCTPMEAMDDIKGIARLENSKDGKYMKRFKLRYREQFKIRQQVKIAKLENIKVRGKENKGRFTENGVLMEKCQNMCT